MKTLAELQEFYQKQLAGQIAEIENERKAIVKQVLIAAISPFPLAGIAAPDSFYEISPPGLSCRRTCGHSHRSGLLLHFCPHEAERLCLLL